MYNIAASDKVVEARTALKDASMKNNVHSTRASQKHLESAKGALDEAYTEALESCFRTKIEELDNLHRKPFSLINYAAHCTAWLSYGKILWPRQ